MPRVITAVALLTLAIPLTGCDSKPPTVARPPVPPTPVVAPGSTATPSRGSGSATPVAAKPEVVYLAMQG